MPSTDAIAYVVQVVIVQFINLLADGVGALVGVLPNPDPFPAMLEGVQPDSSVASRMWYYADQFFDVAAIVGMIGSWFTIFAMAWLIQTLWNWGKAKNKG